MPTPTLVETPGAANANSYPTVAEADAYHDARTHSETWATATTPTKTVALIHATRVLDAMYIWTSWRVTDTQALDWPRSGVLARNSRSYVGDTEIPVELKQAVAELARYLIDEDVTLDNAAEAQGLKSLVAGSIELVFRDDVKAKVIKDSIFYLIPSWWGRVRGRSSLTREIMRA